MGVALAKLQYGGVGADFSWSFTPTGTPKGIVVVTISGNTAVVAGVTYGGTALTEMASSPQGHASPDQQVTAWFLGASIPTGTQTVAIDAGGATIAGYCWQYTATGDTALIDDVGLESASLDDPDVTLSTGNRITFAAGQGVSGFADVADLSARAGWGYLEQDWGAWCSVLTYNATPATTDWVIGFDTTSAEDVAWIGWGIADRVLEMDAAADGTGTSAASDPGAVRGVTATAGAVGVATSDLDAVYARAAQADGLATATTTLLRIRQLLAQIDGTATVAATLIRRLTFGALSAAGTGASTATMAAVRAAQAQAAGLGSVTVDADIVRAVSVLAAGAGASTVTLNKIAASGTVYELVAAVSGLATVSATLIRVLTFGAVSADGSTTTSAAVNMGRALTVSVAGSGVPTSDVDIVRALTLTAAGIASSSADLSRVAATTAADSGKYRREHASAYAMVKDAEDRDYTLSHAMAKRLVGDAGA